MTSNESTPQPASMYEDIFESLLRGNKVDISNCYINQRSMTSQFSKFKAKQFASDWLKSKALHFETSGSITTVTLVPSQKRKDPITFKVNPILEPTHGQENLPTIVGADQSG